MWFFRIPPGERSHRHEPRSPRTRRRSSPEGYHFAPADWGSRVSERAVGRRCSTSRSHRLGQLHIGLQRCSTRLPDLSLRPRAAPPEREPRAAQILRSGLTATVPSQQLALPERDQGGMRLPGHRVRQPAAPGSAPASPDRGSFSQPGTASANCRQGTRTKVSSIYRDRTDAAFVDRVTRSTGKDSRSRRRTEIGC